MGPQRRVALVIETSNDYARGLLHGVRTYIRQYGRWTITLDEHSRGEANPTWLARWRGDGVIARIENSRIARAVMSSGLPAVDVSAARLVPSLPWVETDDRAIARMAADHLAERGLRHFGYVGDERFNWSRWRREHFVEAVRNAGYPCELLLTPRGGRCLQRDAQLARMARWVRGLPKPVGVMVCYDILAQQFLAACRLAGVDVPEEVAVIGVDNDELLCDLCDPPLTSVAPDSEQAGYLAASLLEAMLAGRKVGPEGRRVAPLGVIARQSTDISAIDDVAVSRAVRFIRQHACDGIKAGDVVDESALSRRALELRFHRAIGRTLHDEILRVRLERMKQLLTETEMPLARIAELAGFHHTEYATVFFRRETGEPPSRYRQQRQRSRDR
jgi:LacI family transcriptional regulator